ncbi:MAG TPA: hypothetical protein VMW11_08670 [Candidatus Dormibacteraeota bacterium]|nr:hypothetical protein [Candidatus Dormibacteraeota bacterium]
MGKLFLRYYTVIERPFDDTEGAFLSSPENWMPVLASEATGNGERLLSELGFKVGDRRVTRKIELELGQALRGAALTIRPVRWHAADNAGLFPELDGHIEVAALGAGATQLGLSANYKPPLGLIGQLADRTLLHRVAEVTLKDFVERVAGRLRGQPD